MAQVRRRGERQRGEEGRGRGEGAKERMKNLLFVEHFLNYFLSRSRLYLRG
jgi:hypothetical protein